jgi:hypothetical protein
VTGADKPCLTIDGARTLDSGRAPIRVKHERAKKHLADLAIACTAFFDSSPYQVHTEVDPQTRQHSYSLAYVEGVPDEIPSIAGDVLQNLRSALDHLAYRLFMAGTQGTAGDGKHVSFPIFDDASKFKKGVMHNVKGMRREAIDAIEALKPYSGGNEVLWRLNRLNNIDKHRLLVAVGQSDRQISLIPCRQARERK